MLDGGGMEEPFWVLMTALSVDSLAICSHYLQHWLLYSGERRKGLNFKKSYFDETNMESRAPTQSSSADPSPHSAKPPPRCDTHSTYLFVTI